MISSQNKMSPLGWPFCALCALLVAACTESRAKAQASEDIIRQIVSVAPKKWTEYEERFAGKLRYKYRVSFFDRIAGKAKPGNMGRIEYGTHGTMEWREEFMDRGKAYAFIMNERYSFEVRKTSSETGWVASAVRVRRPGEREGEYATSHLDGKKKSWPAVGPFRASGLWLPVLIQDEAFKIITAKMIDSPSGKLVRFEVGYEKAKKAGRMPKKGWIVLDPNQWWRVCESDIHITYGGSSNYETAHCTVNCEIANDMPILKKVTTHAIGNWNGVNSDEDVTEEYTIDRNDSDPAEFRLTAFGLPEPVGVVWPKATRWWLWISLAAVGSVVIGSSFLKLRRRFQNRQPAPTNP